MKRRSIVWGIVFILAAVAVVALQFVTLPGALRSLSGWATLGIIACAIVMVGTLASKHFSGTLLILPAALIYLMLQGPFAWPRIDAWVLVIAALLAGGGLDLLAHAARRRTWKEHVQEFHQECRDEWDKEWKKASKKGKVAYAKVVNKDALHAEESGDDNYPINTVRFGSCSRYLHSDALTRGLFDVSFASLEIFCDHAQMSPEGATFEARVSFGTLKLYIPASWQVVTKDVAVTIAEAPYSVTNPAAERPVLTLTGTVSFGSIEVERIPD